MEECWITERGLLEFRFILLKIKLESIDFNFYWIWDLVGCVIVLVLSICCNDLGAPITVLHQPTQRSDVLVLLYRYTGDSV